MESDSKASAGGQKRSAERDEEWWPEPELKKKTAPTGVWQARTQELAKAVLQKDTEVAVQLARMYWAGDPALAASK